MEQTDWQIMVILGGVFLIIGLGLLFGCGREENDYYDAISSRHDLREFVSHDPERAEPGSLKVGGWIALVLGLIVMAMGGGLWLWG